MDPNLYFLSVDDDQDDCLLLKEALERRSRAVSLKFVESGDKVIHFLNDAIAKNHLPALIIIDINMPAMDGRSTLLEIKKILPVYIPVLFLTTSPRDIDIKFGEHNTAALMAKPRDIKGYDDLAQTILDLFLPGI
jgi:CheY-like chemotaxis protein